MRQAETVVMVLSRPLCRAAEAPVRVPTQPGYYAIFVDDPEHLPSPYGDLLQQRATELIYIGMATISLRERLVEQDLRHRRHSTFFRGIGAILEFRPPSGSLVGKANQNNYRFSGSDTAAIVDWIDAHLSVNWTEADPALKATESSLIHARRPILNTTHNPDPVPQLATLRDECRRIARTNRHV